MEIVNMQFTLPFTHGSDTEVPFHMHDSYEIVYYFEGQGLSKADTSLIPYTANSYSIFSPSTPHNETHYEKTVVYCVGFSVSNQSKFRIKTGNYKDDDRIIQSHVKDIYQETILQKTHYSEVIDLKLAEILFLHDRHQNEDSYMYDELLNIKKYINENISNTNISIEELASLSGYSYHYFRHIFQQQTGLSPKRYIINLRIEYAKNLLTNSPSSISYIAQYCGFSSSSQFDITFRKHTGISPTQYRKMNKIDVIL